MTPLGFLFAQLLWGPATLVALAGLVALLVDPALKSFRVAGWSCAWAFVILMALHGKRTTPARCTPCCSPAEAS